MTTQRQADFDNQFAHFDKQSNSPINLSFNFSLSDEQLQLLIRYINAHPDKFASSHLSLCVTKAMLSDTHYQPFFDALKKTKIQALNLVFPVDELSTFAHEITKLLNQQVGQRVNVKATALSQGTPARDELDLEQAPVAANASDKKIKLKALIKQAGTKHSKLSQYIELEVQHTEVEQQEQVQEEIINVAAQEQEQEQGLFDGALIDYSRFQNEPYRSLVNSEDLLNAFKYEFFGNMPKAIKFLSHEAAMKIVEQAGAFVALNADNLPQNFLLKRTAQGELVLDYDPYADERNTNVFTPKELPHYKTEALIYEQVALPESVKNLAAKYSLDASSKQLDNLWVRYGEKGVKRIFDALGQPGELSALIIKRYLNRFPHWDRFLDDNRFLEALAKIKQYEPAELTCLSEFLSYTDDRTQFDLTDILKGFDAFWVEWSLLAQKDQLDLDAINGSWSHKKVGSPLVYMERLLTILRNSRKVSEQLTSLDLVLRSIPTKETQNKMIKLAKKTDECTLFKQEKDYFVYGNKADGSGWGLTKLDAKIIAATDLAFPELETGAYEFMWAFSRNEQSFNAKYATIYRHITSLGAHRKADQLSLDNYGAYYASKYEGFHVVSKEMGLQYDPDKQNALPFNPDASVYRTDLIEMVEYGVAKAESKYDWLRPTKEEALAKKERYFLIPCEDIPTIKTKPENKLTQDEVFEKIKAQYGEVIPYDGQDIKSPYNLYKFSKYETSRDNSYYLERRHLREPSLRDEILGKITSEQLIERAHRFIGQQPQGISLPAYTQGLKRFLREFISDTDKSNTILASLFFVAHERYTGVVDAYKLLNAIDRMECHEKVVITNNRSLMKLFQQDIRLNDQEGYAISERIGMLNSAETDRLDKAHYIQKLFTHLQNNKQGTLKAIKHIAKNTGTKWPFIYALDTAEFFMNDSSISGYYYSDLLLFSTLINSEYKEVYFSGRKDKEAAKVHENIARVKEFLLKAATGAHPNNLDYAIKALVQSCEYFTYEQFLTAIQDIDKLAAFDHQAVDEILIKNKFKLQAAIPEVFSRDSGAIKGSVIQLILALEMAEGSTINLTPITDVSERELAGVEKQIKAFETLTVQQAKKAELENKLESDLPTQNAMKAIIQSIDKLEKETAGSSLDELKAKHIQLKAQQERYQRMMKKMLELSQLTIKDLQIRLNELWQTKGIVLAFAAKALLFPILHQLKKHLIDEEFGALGSSSFITQLQSKIIALPGFKKAENFEQIDRIANESASLAGQFARIINNHYFIKNEAQLTGIFAGLDYGRYDYETLFTLLDLLINLADRDYAEILDTYIRVSNSCSNQDKKGLINDINILHHSAIPSIYMVSFITLLPKIKDKEARTLFLQQMISTFKRDDADPLLHWMVQAYQTDKVKGISATSLLAISSLTHKSIDHRAAIQKLFVLLQHDKKAPLEPWITAVTSYPEEQARQMTEILALSCVVTPPILLQKNPIDYLQLTTLLGALSAQELAQLLNRLSESSIALTCLNDGLKNRDRSQPFHDFINQFEKAPFGTRDFAAQFDTKQVERVVNSFVDLNNQSAYPYAYRKQMMEAFLFVNRAGNDLPVYNNKPAKDLSNAEITQLFGEIKTRQLNHLNPFQTRLYALGLMREAMYRTTGEYPYSTQMLALIDCLMHEGDVISNIDMGQGKSMVDTMKATLLWLESGRVDLSTASLVDAKRDLAKYAPFWTMLGVPYTKTAISSNSPFEAYQKQGINVGTMAQFALFYSKAKGEQIDLESEQVSLVLNESDFSILDDRVIYRYASAGGAGLIGVGKEWIYDAVNEFVNKPSFKEGTGSEAQDIAALKNYLQKQAKLQKKSSKFIEQCSEKKLLTLLESALIVNYRLKENFDYVLTDLSEPKLINGVVRQTRRANIIMHDGKISPDTQYGNGMQQLLYAKLNKIHGEGSFVIEPESKTLISSNNKNMIDYYRAKKGFIWGSSGTDGVEREIDLQLQKYGFAFSKVEPHQLNIVTHNKPVIAKNEEAQFKRIAHELESVRKAHGYVAPKLIFFKDIETATRFNTYLKRQAKQLFTGLGNEELAIHQAAESGMVTITTPALGRNTDIRYDHRVGMDVIISSVSSGRKELQQGGRTGRQGSPGAVSYILNEEDLDGRSIEEVRAMLEQQAETERQFNEELYDVLGYLLRHVGQAGKAFFKDQWSEFSEQVESNYRAKKLDGTYQREHFLQEVVTQFNALPIKPVSVAVLKKAIDKRHTLKRTEVLDKQKVQIKDCIAPDVIAYHFVKPSHSDNKVVYLKKEIKTKLTALFAAVNTPNYIALNNDYIAYLNLSKESQAVIKTAHQEFLMDYLIAQVTQAENAPFYKRWLGFEGHLNKMVADSNYLLLFKAMVDVCEERSTELDLRDAVVTLLEEYIQYSWFVSSAKKAAAKQLIAQIDEAETTEQIVEVLSKGTLEVIQKDRETNQNSFWRTIKPVNAAGNSRLQKTLDNALKLTSVLTSKNIKDELIEELSEEQKRADPANAQVAAKRRDSALEHNRFRQFSTGMKGREQPDDANEEGAKPSN